MSLLYFLTFGSESDLNAMMKSLNSSIVGMVTLDIRRENLLEDALKEARKSKFSCHKRLRVSQLFQERLTSFFVGMFCT